MNRILKNKKNYKQLKMENFYKLWEKKYNLFLKMETDFEIKKL